MSVRTMSRVWEHSQHAGSDLLMLLAIADFADDAGNAYPAVSTLAEKCRMTPRNANLILANLRKTGELIIRQNEGPKGTNRYQIHLPTPEARFTPEESFTLKRPSSTPEARFPKPLKPASDEPSVNHQEPSVKSDSRTPRGARLKADWTLPDEYLQWATEDRGWTTAQTKEVAERFKDYWISVSGKAATKADWFAAWRYWCRRERAPAASRTAPMTRHQQNQAAIAASLFGPQSNGLLGQSAKLIEGVVIHGN